MNPHDKIRATLQELLNGDNPEGWIVNHFVICLGMQRMDHDGNVHNTAWVTAPAAQADYITDGLLAAGSEMRENADVEDD